MKYAKVDENNNLLGWYATKVEGAIAVSDTNHAAALYKCHNYVSDEGVTSFVDNRDSEQIAADNVILAKDFLESTMWLADKRCDVVEIFATMTNEEYYAKYKTLYDERAAARLVISTYEDSLTTEE